MRAFLAPLTVALGLTLGFSSCSDISSDTGPGGFGQGEIVADATFLDQIRTAPFEYSFVGTRRVSFHYVDPVGGAQELIYIESVAADGDGNVSIDPLEMIDPILDPERFELFRMVQSALEEFFFNHRDFRIRDVALFGSNYRATVTEPDSRVADRGCVQLRIEAVRKDRNSFLVDVDIETGLILRAREFNAVNRQVGEVVFESIFFGEVDPARFEDVSTTNPVNWRALEDGETFDLPVGAPALPPRGFQLLEERVVTDPLGGEWYELIYGDGSEQMFVFFRLQSVLGDATSVTPDDEVGLFGIGPWVVAEGVLRGQDVIVLGKLSRSEILTTLESCLN